MKTNNTVMGLAPSVPMPNIPMMTGFVTAPQQLIQTLTYAIECVYTGTTIAGSVSIEASLTYDPSSHSAGVWVTVPASSTALTGSGAGIINAGNGIPGYNYFRVRFADTGSSGDAVMTVTANVKGF